MEYDSHTISSAPCLTLKYPKIVWDSVEMTYNYSMPALFYYQDNAKDLFINFDNNELLFKIYDRSDYMEDYPEEKYWFETLMEAYEFLCKIFED